MGRFMGRARPREPRCALCGHKQYDRAWNESNRAHVYCVEASKVDARINRAVRPEYRLTGDDAQRAWSEGSIIARGLSRDGVGSCIRQTESYGLVAMVPSFPSWAFYMMPQPEVAP